MDKKKQPAKKEVVGSVAGVSGSKRAEEALRESEEKFSKVFKLNPTPMAISTLAEGRYIGVNDSFLRLTGYSREEVIGHSSIEMGIWAKPDSRTRMLEMMRDQGNIHNSEYEFCMKSGETRLGLLSVEAIRIGGQQYFLSILNDITERKKVEEELLNQFTILQAIIESPSTPIFLVDRNYCYIAFNSSHAAMMKSLFGADIEIGKSLLDYHTVEAHRKQAKQNIDRAISGESIIVESYSGEEQLSRRFFEIVHNPVMNAAGQVIGASVFVRDLTERKKAERRIQESEQRYQRITEGLTDYLYTVRLQDGQVVETSHGQACKEVTGYTKKEFANNPNLWMNMVVEEERGQVLESVQKILAGENIPPIEHRIVRKDGQIRWVRDTPILQFDSENKLVSYDGVIKDITEHKRAEETLKESEARLRSLFETMSEGIVLIATDGQIISANPAAESILGLARSQIEGRTYDSPQWEMMRPDGTPMPAEEMAGPRAMKEKRAVKDVVMGAVHPDGSVSWISVNASPLLDEVGKLDGVVGTFTDFTERKQAEEALREREALLQATGEMAKVGGWELDLSTNQVSWTEEVGRIHGVERGYKPKLEEAMNFYAPESRPALEAALKKISETGEPYDLESLFIPSGSKDKIWVRSLGKAIYSGGKVVKLTGTFQNIDKYKRAEEALRESEEKYRLVVENAQEAIYIAVDGVLKFGNNKAAELSGYTQEDLSSTPFVEFIHPDDQEMVIDRYLRRLKGEDIPNKYSFRIIDKQGTIRWVELTAVIITWEGKPASLSFLTDISDRKRLEEEQQRVAKLESVGMLAGGIAHDFNNILTSILGNISLARTEAAPGSELHESLEQAEKASQRAKALTVQLLTFSKGGAPVLKLASLTELLKDTAGFALSGSNVKCRFSIPVELWHAEIDAGQVSQVVHNLVINAQQSMPTGGSIEIRAENIALSEMQSLGRGLPLKSGDYIRIAVTDHGTGIPGDHLEKIFDPFFTTKQKGNGMGLAISFSIARQHGGHISVESELGAGSTFYLYLPASVQTSAPKEDKKEAIKPAGKARILVMDDEKGVREIAGRLLKHIGYKDIEFAEDGAEAIKLYKAAMKSGNPFTVAILDLTIAGGMGGEIAIKKLLKIDPGVKAIVSSGYIDDPVMAKHRDHGFSGMVAKPYTIEELRKAVQDAIG
jgi:PAS domain S-box-containing protein